MPKLYTGERLPSIGPSLRASRTRHVTVVAERIPARFDAHSSSANAPRLRFCAGEVRRRTDLRQVLTATDCTEQELADGRLQEDERIARVAYEIREMTTLIEVLRQEQVHAVRGAAH